MLLTAKEYYHVFSFCFLLCLVIFLTIPVVREEFKVKLALTIPSGASATLVNEMIVALPLAVLKTIKILSI